MKKKIVIIISIIIIIIGLILMWQGKKRARQGVFEFVEAKIETIVQEVTATGTIRPASEIELEFTNQGKIKEILVSQGGKVSAGQVLIKLNQAELELRVLEARAGVEAAQAKLDKILAGAAKEDVQLYATAVANTETSLANKKQALADVRAKAQNDLAQAYEDVADILNDAYIKADDALHKKVDELFSEDDTSNPELTFTTADSQIGNEAKWQRRAAGEALDELQNEIANLQLAHHNLLDQALINARQHLTIIRDFLNRTTDALNSAVLSKDLTSSDLSTYKTNLTTARTNVNTGLTNITNQKQTIAAVKVTNQTNITTAQTAVDTAQANLYTAQDQLALKKAAPQTADVASIKAQVKQAQAGLLQAREKLNQAALRAPIESIITKINVEIGEMSRTGQPAISLIGLQVLEIEIDIYEEDVVKLKLGNPVDIALVAFPDQIFNGRVVAIEPAEKIIEEVVYYETIIAFEEAPEGVKPGMTADITIKTNTKENALVIPKEAIQKKDGMTIVKVSQGGNIEEREIEIGIEGKDGMVEVVTGLSEKEKVIVK